MGGPRATELFSAVTAAAVAGVAALARATEVVAEFAAALAARLETAHERVTLCSPEPSTSIFCASKHAPAPQ